MIMIKIAHFCSCVKTVKENQIFKLCFEFHTECCIQMKSIKKSSMHLPVQRIIADKKGEQLMKLYILGFHSIFCHICPKNPSDNFFFKHLHAFPDNRLMGNIPQNHFKPDQK